MNTKVNNLKKIMNHQEIHPVNQKKLISNAVEPFHNESRKQF
jgi:hypothetical protein